MARQGISFRWRADRTVIQKSDHAAALRVVVLVAVLRGRSGVSLRHYASYPDSRLERDTPSKDLGVAEPIGPHLSG
jgi:hypothetical protein